MIDSDCVSNGPITSYEIHRLLGHCVGINEDSPVDYSAVIEGQSLEDNDVSITTGDIALIDELNS